MLGRHALASFSCKGASARQGDFLMTQYAKTTQLSAPLASDFGLELAIRKFGCLESELETLWGRFARGRNKGKLRGFIHWTKCTEGGWSRARGGVIYPGSSGYHLRQNVDPLSSEGTVEIMVRQRKIKELTAQVVEAHPELDVHTTLGTHYARCIANIMVMDGYDMERAIESWHEMGG